MSRRPQLLSPIEQRVAGLGIVALIGFGSILALSLYLWSLDVARVKAETTSLDGRIGVVREQVRRLRTELVIRTRLKQQARWAPALGLQAPEAVQFGQNDMQVRSLAAARMAGLAARAPARPVVETFCTGGACGAAAIGEGRPGYRSEDRKQLDSLIDAYLR